VGDFGWPSGAGEVIITEGQFDNWIYFLISGKLSIQKNGQTINFLKRRGDLFGEMGIIDGSPRSASIIAIIDSVCLEMDTSYLDKLEEDAKAVFCSILYRVFAEILAHRLRKADEELVKTKDENNILKTKLKKMSAAT